VLSELQGDGLISVNHRVRTILQTMEENVDNKNFDPVKYFTQHSDSEISQYASNLLSEKYTESKRWSRGGAFIESETELLPFLVPKLIQEYKLKNVKMLLKKLEHEISEANKNKETEKVMDYLNQYQNLKKVVTQLSGEGLGFRTIS
jgi:DNA primase